MPYPGEQVTVTAEFLSGPTGPLTDVTGLTITITSPASVVELATTSTGIVHAATGVYRYTWTVPTGAPTGDHLVLWSANAGAVTAVDTIAVSSTAGTWCTTDDVLLLTGKTVSDTQLAQASTVLELHLGRTFYELVSNPDGGTVKVGRRDREWLRRACAYQAAWMLAQPDMYQRIDMDAMASPGRPITLKDRALVLAPLARRALQRVSWLRSRSLHARTPFTDGLSAISPNPSSEANDAFEIFTPMGG